MGFPHLDEHGRIERRIDRSKRDSYDLEIRVVFHMNSKSKIGESQEFPHAPDVISQVRGHEGSRGFSIPLGQCSVWFT